VKPAPNGQIKEFFLDRIRSFGLVVGIGFLLVVSLAASAALSAISTWLGHWAPGVPAALQVLNVVLSILGTAVLFMMLFKFLPDVELSWPDVGTGAAITAVLFTAGKQVIGLYLGHSSTASSYGAIGSVLVLLLWVYYTSQIVLIGAEFTRLYAQRFNGPVQPSSFAEKTTAPRATGTALPA
jgi:membrane protein